MAQLATEEQDALGLYVDVPPTDLEAAAFLQRLDALLSVERRSSRDTPSFVSRKAARAWRSDKRGVSARRFAYFVGVSRDLAGQIPVVGPFLKALLPRELQLPIETGSGSSTAPLRFLIKRSSTRPTVLAIDNVQFLPFAVREMLEIELAEAGSHLRLVLVERVHGEPRINWSPPVPGADFMDVDLGKVGVDEVRELVQAVLPEADDADDLAAAVLRRSEGNLKSVWYQLRLIASRRDQQDAPPASYEDVIQTLAPLDQTVLRFVVFTLGGLTIATLAALLRVSDLRLRPDAVTHAIADLGALGLLVVNGESADRVRIEHELVAQIVSELTPEEEKLELRGQILAALSALLDERTSPSEAPILYDRLLGIVNDVELRQTPSLLSHIVEFVQSQSELDQHRYLSSICRDSACWDVLDILPDTTVRTLLDAIQKSALFSFGLIATARLRRSSNLNDSLASLYEAKYLVQLFRYEEALTALERVTDSKERRAVAFNITLSLAEDEQAAEITTEVYAEVAQALGSEQDYVILRNSIHLFEPAESLRFVEAALDGFRALGRRFGAATALNNRGIVELALPSTPSAQASFEAARLQLESLGSTEVYQPLVNLSALAAAGGDVATAGELLDAARDAAPRSLAMDSAMFEMNRAVLDLCADRCSVADAAASVRAVVNMAQTIRDLRFLCLATWFAENLEAAAGGGSGPAASSASRVAQIRGNGCVPLELFVPYRRGTVDLELPFTLSPHWRY